MRFRTSEIDGQSRPFRGPSRMHVSTVRKKFGVLSLMMPSPVSCTVCLREGSLFISGGHPAKEDCMPIEGAITAQPDQEIPSVIRSHKWFPDRSMTHAAASQAPPFQRSGHCSFQPPLCGAFFMLRIHRLPWPCGSIIKGHRRPGFMLFGRFGGVVCLCKASLSGVSVTLCVIQS